MVNHSSLTGKNKPVKMTKRVIKMRVAHLAKSQRIATLKRQAMIELRDLLETERVFEQKFPVTKGTLAQLLEEAIAEDEAGLTEELDPNNL